MQNIEINEFYRIRLKACQYRLGEFLKEVKKIVKDLDETKFKALLETQNLEMEFYIESIKKHEYIQQKNKDHRLKVKYLQMKPILLSSPKLSNYEVARIRGNISCLYDLIQKLNEIISTYQKNNKINLFNELMKLKTITEKEESQLNEILLKTDSIYQKERLLAIKQYLIDPE